MCSCIDPGIEVTITVVRHSYGVNMGSGDVSFDLRAREAELASGVAGALCAGSDDIRWA